MSLHTSRDIPLVHGASSGPGEHEARCLPSCSGPTERPQRSSGGLAASEPGPGLRLGGLQSSEQIFVKHRRSVGTGPFCRTSKSQDESAVDGRGHLPVRGGLPGSSPLHPLHLTKRWSQIFKSRMVTTIALYGNTWFMVAIAILVFLLIDAFREVRKYSVTDKVDVTNNPTAIEHIHMKLFRAQRNEYIAGFALLLCLLLRRLATLLSQQATLMASNQAFRKQAEGASTAAKTFMEENELLQEKLRGAGIEAPEAGKKGAGLQEENKTLKEELKTLKEQLQDTKKALQKSDSDVSAMKKQSENLTVEYDRLLEEHSKMLASSDKKSD